MPKKAELEAMLREKGVVLAGPIVSTQEDNPTFLAFVKAKISTDGRREPTSFALNSITKAALEIGVRVSFVLIDGERDDLDSSVKTMLLGKFPELIRNSFSTFSGKLADVWIDPKQILDTAEKAAIEGAVSDFLGFLDVTAKSINFTQAENIPTPTALLRSIRVQAPCSIDEITGALAKKGFTVPNKVWLSHAMDKLRKSGFIFRKKNGQFILTLKGLTALGTSKNRQSPDVTRALALAQKGR
ncbi:MAG TPA: hypothetical protein PKD10_18720 [Paracoccaceae bacterium]|nr:hypothetical protein [Paracoccaceae bacterium]